MKAVLAAQRDRAEGVLGAVMPRWVGLVNSAEYVDVASSVSHMFAPFGHLQSRHLYLFRWESAIDERHRFGYLTFK